MVRRRTVGKVEVDGSSADPRTQDPAQGEHRRGREADMRSLARLRIRLHVNCSIVVGGQTSVETTTAPGLCGLMDPPVNDTVSGIMETTMGTAVTCR